MGTRGWSTEEFKSYSKSKGRGVTLDGEVLESPLAKMF